MLQLGDGYVLSPRNPHTAGPFAFGPAASPLRSDSPRASGGQAFAGAAVTVAVTDPKGVRSTLTAKTNGSGNASAKVSVKPKDPSGVYQAQVTASGGGATGQAATSFTIQ